MTSTDGTPLAVWVAGSGPAIVMVHGSMQDHTGAAELIRELSRDHTTFALDRRGFGASGDAPVYALRREFEDVATVVDAVAERRGLAVVLWGHSFGAGVALGGAALTPSVSHLVLYEPSLGMPSPPGWIDRVEEAIATGRHEEALILVLRDILELSAEQIREVRARPGWTARLATAPTIAREARAEQGWRYRPEDFAHVVAPALLLSGALSPAPVRRATDSAAGVLRHARLHVLEGHAHLAHRTAPSMVGAVVREFLDG